MLHGDDHSDRDLTRTLHRDDVDLHVSQVDGRNGVRRGAVNGAGVQDERFADPLLLGHVRVAVADQVVIAGFNSLAE